MCGFDMLNWLICRILFKEFANGALSKAVMTPALWDCLQLAGPSQVRVPHAVVLEAFVKLTTPGAKAECPS